MSLSLNTNRDHSHYNSFPSHITNSEYHNYPSGFDTSKFRVSLIRTCNKSQKNKTEERDYIDPFHSSTELAMTSRGTSPGSPLDRMDEYGDVAGQYFRDIMIPRVPSRRSRGKREGPRRKYESRPQIFQQVACLPVLKTTKPAWAKFQQRPLDKSGRPVSPLRSKPIARTAGKELMNQSQESPFADGIAPPVMRMLLYRYQSLMMSSKSDILQERDKGGDAINMTVFKDCVFTDLQNTILSHIYGPAKLNRVEYLRAVKLLKIWFYDDSIQRWSHIRHSVDWERIKLLASSCEEPMKLMHNDCKRINEEAPFVETTTESGVSTPKIEIQHSTSEMWAARNVSCPQPPPSRPAHQSTLLSVGIEQTELTSSPVKQRLLAKTLEQKLLLSRR
mmetsp:Transcript_16886/g.25437  ORF Transcript_16886/g.25437 Transcript_16886/m.25437 type:complete len:390 (-) Transcript_16886:146-1315(-)